MFYQPKQTIKRIYLNLTIYEVELYRRGCGGTVRKRVEKKTESVLSSHAERF